MKTSHAILLSLAVLCSPAAADNKTIVGTGGNAWKEEVTAVKAGDVVTWGIEGGQHGVMFVNFEEAKKVLDIDTAESLEIKEQPGYPLPAQGTVAKAGAGAVLVKATVKQIPEGMTEVPFFCTKHPKMAGKLKLEAASGSGKKSDKPRK
jgi:plastocyanin